MSEVAGEILARQNNGTFFTEAVSRCQESILPNILASRHFDVTEEMVVLRDNNAVKEQHLSSSSAQDAGLTERKPFRANSSALL